MLPASRAAVTTTVTAALTLEIDGVAVDINGDGDTVVVDVSRPAALARSLVGVPVPVVGVSSASASWQARTFAARAADGLAAHGVTVIVRSPQGLLLRAGRGVAGSWRDRLLSGSARVRFGHWSAWRGPASAAISAGWQRLRSGRRRRR